MNTEIRDDDVCRVRLGARHRQTLETVLRAPPLAARELQPELLEGGEGGYSVVLFVVGACLPQLRQHRDLAVLDCFNISAQLRALPRMSIDAERDSLAAAVRRGGEASSTA